MLAVTRKTGYGLIAMAHLARMGGGCLVSAKAIADQFDVPKALLSNVLKELSAAGYVESVRGVRGGYRLARRPEEINMADLIGTVERPVRMAQCVTAEHRTECSAEHMASCPMADPVHRVQRKLNDFLKGLTLAEICGPAGAKDGGGNGRPARGKVRGNGKRHKAERTQP